MTGNLVGLNYFANSYDRNKRAMSEPKVSRNLSLKSLASGPKDCEKYIVVS